MAKMYTVAWLIDVDAESPEEAAQVALAIQRDNDSQATNFQVREYDGTTDLLKREWQTVEAVSEGDLLVELSHKTGVMPDPYDLSSCCGAPTTYIETAEVCRKCGKETGVRGR